MSDRSEMLSPIGEWEESDDYYSESLKARDDMISEMTERMKMLEVEMKTMSEVMKKKDAEMEAKEERMIRELKKRDEEIKKKDEELLEKEEEFLTIRDDMKALSRENALLLKSKIPEKENVFTLDKWMKRDIERMQLSTERLNKKTMEVYKMIWENGVEKAQNTSASKRRQMTARIQKLEDLCDKIAKDVKKLNEENIHEITKSLNGWKVEELTEVERTQLLAPFLGTYGIKERASTWWDSFEIKKAAKEGCYEISWVCIVNGMISWIPDGVMRDDVKVWIEKERVLRLIRKGRTHKIELCDEGIKWDGKLYLRVV